MGAAVALRERLETEERFSTVEEYLAFDAASDLRYELHGNEGVCVSGASREHNLIAAYILTLLITQLEETDCEVYGSDMRVHTEGPVPYCYPDVAVVCGGPVYDVLHADTLLNPTVVIEVLSDSTQATDRGAKWLGYRRLDSLTDYLLVDQYTPSVEHYSRNTAASEWAFVVYEGLEATVPIESIGCTLALKDVYKRIRFAASAAAPKLDENEQE